MACDKKWCPLLNWPCKEEQCALWVSRKIPILGTPTFDCDTGKTEQNILSYTDIHECGLINR